MIPAGVQVFLALEPVDMRFGFERLSGLDVLAALAASRLTVVVSVTIPFRR